MAEPASTDAGAVELLYTLAKMYADDEQVAAGMVREAIASTHSRDRSTLISALFTIAQRGALPGRTGLLHTHLSAASSATAIERFLDSHLPYSFAALRPEDRMLLTLVDGLDEDHSEILLATGLDEHGLNSLLFTIRRRLLQDLNAAAPLAIKRQLPASGIGEEHLRPAVHRLVHQSRESVPANLVPAAAPETTAFAAPRSRVEPTRRRRRSTEGLARRFYVAFLAIAVAGGAGFILDKAMNRPPVTDMIELVIRDASDTDPALLMSDIAAAERFLSDHSARRVRLPSIAGATLHGVSVRTVKNDVALPAAFFTDSATGTTMAVYVSSYSALSSYGPAIQLDRSVLRQIEDELTFDLHNRGGKQVLVWRDRSTIFLAVADESVAALFSRIAPAAL